MKPGNVPTVLEIPISVPTNQPIPVVQNTVDEATAINRNQHPL